MCEYFDISMRVKNANELNLLIKTKIIMIMIMNTYYYYQ